MKKHFLRGLTAALTLALLLTACGQKQEDTRNLPDEPSAEDALRAVLLGEGTFYDPDYGESLDLAALMQRLGDEDGAAADFLTAPQEFTVSRFGGETLCAVVSLGGTHDDCSGYLLLHWFDGTVRGEVSTQNRGLSQLKADGGYPWMLGGANYGWSYLTFSDGRLLPGLYLTAQQRQDSTEYDPIYYLRSNGADEEISEETFTALYGAETAKPDARWYALTAETVDAALTGALAAPTAAQARGLYSAFFTGNTTVTANLINAGVEATTASFRVPDIYATKGVDGSDMDWTIKRFALLDMDGDGVDELVLDIDYRGDEEYVVLTCYDGAVCASQIVYRGFLSPKADGTFEWSNGAFDNGASRARFENGVLVYEDFAAMAEGSDGNTVYTLNGESVDEIAYNAFLDEQTAKADLSWTEFSVDAVNAALAG